MPTPRTVAEIQAGLASHGFEAEVLGDPARRIESVAPIDDADERQITFVSNPKYLRALETTRAGAVIVGPDVTVPQRLTALRAADPYAAVTAAIIMIHGYRRHAPPPAGSAAANVHATARVGPGATLHPGVTICADAQIGPEAVIYPGCFVGPRVRIGARALLYPNVVIYEDCVLGDRVTIHANAIIGEDGLGYAPLGGKWLKIPQIGNVVIEDDVEIGAGCAIDRATLGSTRIGAGTKLSNLIAVGHGTRIGAHCMLVAQVGLAGSVTVGDHVTMAGQAGIVGHISIGDRAKIGAKAGVTNDVAAGETVLGQPAVPITEAKRRLIGVAHLPKLREQIKELQRQVDELARRAGDAAH